MNLDTIKTLCENNLIYMTEHVILRCRQRNIKQIDIKNCIISGEIIEDYPEDYPFPSCLILGFISGSKPLHIVVACDGEYVRVVTAYYPDDDKWEKDFKIRR